MRNLWLITTALVPLSLIGATVSIPAEGNIQAAVDANPSGTIFQLAAGTYRMQVVVPKNGDQFIGTLDTAGRRTTTLTGAQVLTAFTRDAYGNFVTSAGQTQPGQQTGQCAWGYARCSFPEDFFYDNQPYLHSSTGPASLSAGQYYFDYPAGRIYFRPRNSSDDPAQHTVEYSRARVAFTGGASGVVVKNLIVEKYAIPAQFGAVGDQYPGTAWIIQNNEVRFNHGRGINVAANAQVLDNYVHDNGQMGLGGSGNSILVQGNEIAHNVDYAGIDCGWECGGFKFAFTDGLTVRNNYSHDNLGPGMWTDLNVIRTLYENNTVTNNSGPGIFHEISYDAVIRNNTIRNNGAIAPDDWYWNGQIQISTSQNVEIYGNTIELNSATNANGIMLIQQNRSNDPCSYGPCRVTNNYIHDNNITVTGTRWHGSSGGAQDYTGYGDLFATASNNRFVANHYHVTDTASAAYWAWANNNRTFPGFQSFGLEAGGTVDANVSGDLVAPTVPAGVVATPASASQVNLSWTASSDNTGVTGYRVYRGGVQIATSTVLSLADTGLAPGTSYSYSVSAVDAAGNTSAQSAAVTATTKAAVIQTGSRVGTTGSTAIRSKANTNSSSKVLGTQPAGSRGTVTVGQVAAGVAWWFVDFDSGVDGWVQQSSLTLY